MAPDQPPNFLTSLEKTLELIAFNVSWFYLAEDSKYKKVHERLCSLGPDKNYLELAPLAYGVLNDRTPFKMYEMIHECQRKGRENDYASMFQMLLRIMEAFNEIYAAKYGGVPFKLNKEAKALVLENANVKVVEETIERTNWILFAIRNVEKGRLNNGETVKPPLPEILSLVIAELAKLKKTGRGYGKQTIRKILIKRGYLPGRPGGHA